jgi:hypothetical protein
LEKGGISCFSQRFPDERENFDVCGKEGKYFEPRETE